MSWLRRTAIRSVCAYCGADMGEKEPKSDPSVSHGTCPRCELLVAHEAFGDPLPEGVTEEQFAEWRRGVDSRRRTAAGTDWAMVRSIAEQVRGGAMVGRYEEPNELDRGGPYSNDEIEGGRYPHQPGEDTGGCDTMSEYLVDVLHSVGIRARTVYGHFNTGDPAATSEDARGGYFWPHVWAEVDGRIVDITADQFNGAGIQMPRVYISDGPNPRYIENE